MASPDIIDHSPQHADPSPAVPTASNLILIDNYDSFTWNVYQYLVLEGATCSVYRNDQITLEELIAKKPTQLVISPGPGHPTTDSGISRDAIRHFAGKIPIFGVCMGQQCILDLYGGDVNFAGEILHGKTSPLCHDSKGVYAGMAQNLPVTRYHSLAGTHVTVPDCLDVTSWIPLENGSKGVIMGVRHKEFLVEGVQFHPESILSKNGRIMIKNFVRMKGGTWDENRRLQEQVSETNKTPMTTDTTATPKKNSILQQIYTRQREAVAIQKLVPSQRPQDLQAAYDLNAAPPQISFIDRLRQSPFDVSLMAEIKRGSPSKGIFALDIDAPTQARKYALAGASVISVLTEPHWFKGSIEDLRAVRQVLHSMPNRPAILRKDFIFDKYQILEGRLAGADTVLLIVKMLDVKLLTQLYKYSQSLGMEPLVEVQNAQEMKIAVELGSKVIGVNNRNLESFEVDLSTTSRLRRLVPKETIICALSGINTYEDVLANCKDGVNAVLVGEAIMRAPDASVFIQQLCAGKVALKNSTPPAPLLTKICGTRTPEAALAAAEAGADLVGMILAPNRKRTISDEGAKAISQAIHGFARPASEESPSRVTAEAASDFFATSASKLTGPGRTRPLLVGVFLDQSLEEILSLQRRYSLDIVQLHGSEPLEWSSSIPVPVIRRFAPGSPGLGARGYHAVPLLDPGAGSGSLFDPSGVQSVLESDKQLRVVLAGGLNAENLAEAVKSVGEVAERVIGVDVSSGVEVNGQQSLEKIQEFIKAAKAIR